MTGKSKNTTHQQILIINKTVRKRLKNKIKMSLHLPDFTKNVWLNLHEQEWLMARVSPPQNQEVKMMMRLRASFSFDVCHWSETCGYEMQKSEIFNCFLFRNWEHRQALQRVLCNWTSGWNTKNQQTEGNVRRHKSGNGWNLNIVLLNYYY